MGVKIESISDLLKCHNKQYDAMLILFLFLKKKEPKKTFAKNRFAVFRMVFFSFYIVSGFARALSRFAVHCLALLHIGD